MIFPATSLLCKTVCLSPAFANSLTLTTPCVYQLELFRNLRLEDWKQLQCSPYGSWCHRPNRTRILQSLVLTKRSNGDECITFSKSIATILNSPKLLGSGRDFFKTETSISTTWERTKQWSQYISEAKTETASTTKQQVHRHRGIYSFITKLQYLIWREQDTSPITSITVKLTQWGAHPQHQEKSACNTKAQIICSIAASYLALSKIFIAALSILIQAIMISHRHNGRK